ncbi:hypothetical protein UVI_02015110 [Ustilaginoidea virens]|nr:hypothetical protein UVI_02015110 [Ustilaginoidea virens]
MSTEATPLIIREVGGHGAWTRKLFSLEHRVLLAGFLITLSFSYTQVS